MGDTNPKKAKKPKQLKPVVPPPVTSAPAPPSKAAGTQSERAPRDRDRAGRRRP
jgi:hypothetical protein